MKHIKHWYSQCRSVPVRLGVANIRRREVRLNLVREEHRKISDHGDNPQGADYKRHLASATETTAAGVDGQCPMAAVKCSWPRRLDLSDAHDGHCDQRIDGDVRCDVGQILQQFTGDAADVPVVGGVVVGNERNTEAGERQIAEQFNSSSSSLLSLCLYFINTRRTKFTEDQLRKTTIEFVVLAAGSIKFSGSIKRNKVHKSANNRMIDKKNSWKERFQLLSESAACLRFHGFTVSQSCMSCYLVEDCELVAADDRRQLRSWDITTFVVPRTNTRRGDRAFPVARTRLWNSLPSNLRQSDLTLHQFRRALKTYLFGWLRLQHQWLVFRVLSIQMLLLTYLLTYTKGYATVNRCASNWRGH